MDKTDVKDVLNAVTAAAAVILTRTEHLTWLHLLKKLAEAGIDELAVTRLTAVTGDLVREDAP